MKTSIIATGYSLKGVDLNKIEGHKIAVNYAFKYFDYDLLCAFDDPIKYGFPVDERLHTNILYVDKHKLDCSGWYRGKSPIMVKDDTRQIFGRSGSLFCAINVAFKLGFKELHIYGADMELSEDNYCHFYDKEPIPRGALLNRYVLQFKRHRNTKKDFMRQLERDEQIIWH